MARMVGSINKPFCGNCCSETPQGSGKARKRVGTKVQKAREKRQVGADVLDDTVPYSAGEWSGILKAHLAGVESRRASEAQLHT